MRGQLRLYGLIRDQRGVAALEFALIAALFLVPLFLGIADLTSFYRYQGKLNAVAEDTAQMVSVFLPPDSTQGVYNIQPFESSGEQSLQDICQGAAAAFAPYPADGMAIKIASATLESGPNGLPQTNSAFSAVYSNTPVYNGWEQDFVVSAGQCVPDTSAPIGSLAVIANMLTTDTPNSSAVNAVSSGVIQSPCDDGIIVEVQARYPGLLGFFVPRGAKLSQITYARWNYATTTSQLLCSACTVSASSSGPGMTVCNGNNVGAQN